MGYGDRDKGPDTAILTLLFLLFSLLFIFNSFERDEGKRMVPIWP